MTVIQRFVGCITADTGKKFIIPLDTDHLNVIYEDDNILRIRNKDMDEPLEIVKGSVEILRMDQAATWINS